ncbi:ABC transporter ATP-binding protein [Afifella pfennigii]|uniref:ABC transporter ATP-binding protein n=1 Tax=Afifella pfennigii TaxID=209897 RepID=UPI00047B9131|nr:ABC transporter ATP-binding protein [Afifella pfennigii]
MREPAIFIDKAELTLGSGRSRVHVLRGASLSIPAGEVVGLVGPSGSGKSTLLMVVAGLERVDTGRVVIAGRDYAGMNEDALAAFRGSEIGFVFQAFHLMQTMTALENVAVPLELSGETDAFSRAEAMLARVGLGQRLTHYPAALSGGEQQRVAIARALVTRPAILIADEPTGNLDGDTGREIADLLFETSREHGATLLLVTHDRELAARCDRTVRISAGHIEPEAAAPRQPLRAVAETSA